MPVKTFEVPVEVLNEARRAAGKEPLDATGTVEVTQTVSPKPVAQDEPRPAESPVVSGRTLASTVLTFSVVGAGAALASVFIAGFSAKSEEGTSS